MGAFAVSSYCTSTGPVVTMHSPARSLALARIGAGRITAENHPTRTPAPKAVTIPIRGRGTFMSSRLLLAGVHRVRPIRFERHCVGIRCRRPGHSGCGLRSREDDTAGRRGPPRMPAVEHGLDGSVETQ